MTLAESWRLYGDLLEKKGDELVDRDRSRALPMYAAAELAEEVAKRCEREEDKGP